jgi:hypothetical protein
MFGGNLTPVQKQFGKMVGLCVAHAWKAERLIELFGPAQACGANHRFRPRPDVCAVSGDTSKILNLITRKADLQLGLLVPSR